MATMLPSEYGMAKFDGLLIALCFPGNHDKVAKKLQAHPRQKHMPKPHNRWLYVKLGMQPSSLLLKKPPPPLLLPLSHRNPFSLTLYVLSKKFCTLWQEWLRRKNHSTTVDDLNFHLRHSIIIITAVLL